MRSFREKICFVFFYVPAKVHNDSAFPFAVGDDVEIVIAPEGGRLIVRRVDEVRD